MQQSPIGKQINKSMIQRGEIIGLMNGTIPYTDNTLSRLSDLIEEYPYFQTAHLLHTLNLLHLEDTHFLFALRRTAVYIPDRKQLFFRVEGDFFTPELIETLEKKTAPPDASFELVDAFLSGSVEKKKSKNLETESSPVSADYVSYFLSDKTENKEAPPLKHQETIDKFLEKDADSPLKIKLNRLDEPEEEFPQPFIEPFNNDTFFSETLAKIYIKQKKYSKALEIIRKLNLIYPEKNRYFADQIRFLEKLIINTNKIK
jgi:hypothetical protein